MDIACPNCAATYRVPDALIASGNPLRCAACGHEWVPQPPLPVHAGPVHAEPDHTEPVQAEPQWAPPAELEPEPPAFEPLPIQEAPAPPPARVPPPLAEAYGAGPGIIMPLPGARIGPPDLAPRRRRDVPRRAAASWRLLPVAWIASLCVVLLFALGLVLYRARIAAAWPPFERLAGLIGS
ncbi:MAG: hypothetical protein JWR10_811 [Rubritepida sp.]|nr:hypothetical protein [Rubritepida sp.]